MILYKIFYKYNKYLLLLDYLALYNRHIQVIIEYFVVVY